MTETDSGCSSECPVGEILGAVLGTFFGTLLFCAVLALLLVLVYRRRQQRLMTAQRIAACSMPRKPNCSPASVQTYINGEYLAPDVSDNHSTLPIRNSESADNADVDFTSYINAGECDDEIALARGSHIRQGQQIMQLRLEGQDVLGKGFNIRVADETGKLVISEVLSSASDVLRSLMNAGDELLRIDISVVPQMSLDEACTTLRAAAACPVRLTLLRQRRESQPDVHASSTTVDLEQDQSGGRSSRPEYLVDGGPESSWISSPEYLEPPLSEAPLRWRSEEMTRGRTADTAVDDEFDGRQRSQSFDAVGRGLPQMPAGSVSGPVGVHSTYIDLSMVVPASQSSPSERRSDNESISPPAPFYKTQSSPTLDKMSEPLATFLASSSTQNLSQSVDELYTYVRRRESSDVQENEDLEGKAVASLSSSNALYATAVDSGDSTYMDDGFSHLERPDEEFEDDHDYCNVPDNNGRSLNDGKTEPVLPTPLFADYKKEVSTSAAEPAYVNHSNVHLQQASATGVNGRRPLRTAVDYADLGGVEKALRAPERAAAGGVAYYINLEDHHFRGFPGQVSDSSNRAHSADDLRTS